MNRYASLTLFLTLVVGGGLAIGFITAPGAWYGQLVKPDFNPPNWLFAPVWTALYILIAIAGWLVWREDARSIAMRLWGSQLVLNFLWSPIFFAAHEIGLGLIVILLLLATILAFIAAAGRRHPAAARLFIPYAAWVAFASTLNAAIYALN